MFFFYSGATPSAVRYKNWKMYYTMAQGGAEGWIQPLIPYHFTLVQNIKRDPFEQAVGPNQKTAMGLGGALAARDCIPLRLEHAADRPTALGEGADVVQDVPAAAGTRDLQPQGTSWKGQEGRGGRLQCQSQQRS